MQCKRWQPTAVTTLMAVALSGCGGGRSAASAAKAGSVPVGAGAALQGKVFGGQQPVAGSTIQLYTVGTGGTGSAATALLTSMVVSDANGNFNITGKYSCSTATQVYITVSGGNAGAGSNNGIGLMAALGPCSALTSATTIDINELTTVAAAYALAPFATDVAHVGAARNGATALANAFGEARMLVDTTSGTLATAPAGVALPGALMDSMANILAACVNSNNSFVTCQQLYVATGAADTLGAMLTIAKHPATAVTTLWGLQSGQPVFAPTLSAQPNDFTLMVKYAGVELSTPFGIAIDSAGSAWVTNETGSTVVKLPALSGAFATNSYGGAELVGARGIAIDCSGTVWVANTGANNVVELNSAGAVLSGAGFNGGTIATPTAVAVDPAGNAWVTNFTGDSVTKITPAGVPTNMNGGGSLHAPSAVAIDIYGRAVVASSEDGQMCVLTKTGSLQGCASDGLLFGPTAIAVSATDAVAMAGSTTGASVAGAFTLANSSGSVIAGSPSVARGGLSLPVAVAYDGAGNTWFANTGTISEFSGENAVSPATGYGSVNAPAGIAVDQGGNVWTTNTGDNSVSIFVGLGSPTSASNCVSGGVQ